MPWGHRLAFSLFKLAERRALSCLSVRSFYCANACDYFIMFVCIILIKKFKFLNIMEIIDKLIYKQNIVKAYNKINFELNIF